MTKGTGFHQQDPDWTKGRAIAIDQADAAVRMQKGLDRKIGLIARKESNRADTP